MGEAMSIANYDRVAISEGEENSMVRAFKNVAAAFGLLSILGVPSRVCPGVRQDGRTR